MHRYIFTNLFVCAIIFNDDTNTAAVQVRNQFTCCFKTLETTNTHVFADFTDQASTYCFNSTFVQW